MWNVTRFAETLLPLFSSDQDEAAKMAEAVLSRYPERFRAQHLARFHAKFALPANAPVTVIEDGLHQLAEQQVDFTLFFRNLTRVADGGDSAPLAAMFFNRELFGPWFEKWRAEANPSLVAGMRAANPILIPRNHRVEHAIQRGYAGDFTPFHRLVDALAMPYSDQPQYADLEAPPRPDEIVHQTFCGT
jgi:uncharacterized protein YdiU (UPF0061 family)